MHNDPGHDRRGLPVRRPLPDADDWDGGGTVSEYLPNKFVEWDQDRLRILWMAGIPNFLRKTPADGESYPRQVSLEIIAAVVKHLANGRDTRSGIARSLKIGEKTVDRAFTDLRAEGRLVKEYNKALKIWFYSIAEAQE